MIADPARYAYSRIDRRPPLTLPGGAHVAVWVVSNNEFYELDPPLGGVRRPWPRIQPDVTAYSWRDYGNRAGLWRVLEATDALGITGSVSLNAAVCDHHPEVVEACVERGWEHFPHGIYNTRYLFGLSEAQERAVIEDCVEAQERLTGERPVGWLSPALTNTERTLDLLAEYGFLYTCDLFHDDQPFPVRVASGRLISIPYTLDLNDVIVYSSYHYTPEHYGEMIRDNFDVLYREARETGSARVMCVSLHPYLVGQPHRLRHFTEAMEHVLGHPGVWATRGCDIAEWYMARHYDEVAAAVGHTPYGEAS